MVKYTLTYFNGRGRGEVSRLLFAQAEVQYEDKRIEDSQWPAVKATLPTGQMPVLDVDGVRIVQSMAIARYLAREFSMYGSTNMEATMIDVVCDCITDFFVMGSKARFSEGAEKEKADKAFREKPAQLYPMLSDILKKNGTGFIAGNKVSLGDFVVYHYLDLIMSIDPTGHFKAEQQKYPELVKHAQKIANLPKIKEWIAKRPVTPW